MTEPKKVPFNRDYLANWYARRHLQTDTGVVQIYYLPANSPDREIRLLEVNSEITETSEMEPIDFGVDVGSADQHALMVLDVTPSQWEAIKAGKLPLPKGWSLDSHTSISRN